ncbi:hypothetical protein B6A10_14370 [Flavobacterium sp. L1I52]|uniref:DUF7507 domain-containing protein n=1 Tax=Flavobacterium pokkalii TaxID=1940408 RepID=A0ABR7UTV8_9FLAO|nr:gliding motility-associated C-terminal domain-containing protein [Flavobacterium pokkalii]MBD0726361.1 hypothetical protein [Flavobacterium pokkalii]
MRNNYFNLLNNKLIKTLQLTAKFNMLALFLGFLILSFNSYGQNNADDPVPFVSSNFANLSVSENTTAVLCVGCGVSNEANLIDADLTNYATASTGVLSVGVVNSLRVTDGTLNKSYVPGTFTGFKIGTGSQLLSLDLLNGITIRTYLDGVLQETNSGNGLLSLSLLSGTNENLVGFNTLKSFDAVEIVLNGTVSLLSATNVFYAVIKEYSAGPDLVCNTVTKMSFPTYPVTIDQANTGFSGLLSAGSVSNTENAISADDSDYATINFTVGALANASIAIKDQVTNYPAGTYAGVEIENTGLLDLSVLGNIVVSTYLDGILKEQFSGNNLLANVGLLPAAGRFKLGFVSSQSFDEVKLTINQTVGLSLATTRVYGAVFEKFCAGPDLACNTQTPMTAPTYPVYVNNANSGINGLVCALCTVTNQDNLIDADLTNYASVNLAVGVGTSGSLSVKNQITDYPAGTFAGYTIENPALLNVGALDSVIITTYLNGIQQETKTGNGPLVSVGTDLLVSTGKQTLGFVSTMPFDEVKITFQNTVSVNLGEVKVYNSVFQKLCEPVVECNKTYTWTNPDFPVIIDTDHSGVEGVACVSCAVTNTNNLLTADETDYANITLVAGVVGSGSVAVKDQLFTYPKGTFAGFVIDDLGTLAQVNLFQSLQISTYNDGILQESQSAGQLIDLSLLGLDVLGSVPGAYNVGFKATLPFDEIRLTLNSVASVINSINVYGAFVDTSESDGGDGSTLNCNASSISVLKEGTYVDANSDGKVNPGDRIDYTFEVKNTGFKTVSNVTLTDDNATVSGGPIASLEPGASDTTTFTATYAITQADIDKGVVYNLATANAISILGTPLTATSTDPTPCTTCPVNPDCPDCTATEVLQTDGIALVKTAVVSGTGVKGDVITYTFTVTNTGNTTLTNVVVTDPMTGLVISGGSIASLAPGATNSTIIGTYIITQADIDAGKVSNQATVTAKDPFGNVITDLSGTSVTTDDSTETPVTQNPSIALVKTASVSGLGGLGDTVTYTFAVTNTGNTTLTNVVITDPLPDLVINGSPIASLAPGATSLAITGTYSIKQTDLDAGKVSNQATVTAKDPQNNDVTDLSGTTILTDDTTETPVGARSTIALVKTASVGGSGGLGDIITYTFAVTNTGTTTLTNVVVTDPMVGLIITGNPVASIAPGITDSSITGTYVITQADIDAGQVVNSALVTAKDPSNNDVTDISGTTIGTNDNTITPITQNSTITLVKTASVGGSGGVGDVITYTFTIHNTGNTTLKNILVSDPMPGLLLTSNLIASLAPDADTTITGTYVITQADVDAGKVSNQATVTAKDPQNNNVTDLSGTSEITNDPTEVTFTKSASIAFVKTGVYKGNATKAKVGDKITYTFTVTNTGNVTIKNVTINDTKLGITNLVVSPSTLAPLASGVATMDYTITQADIDAGKVTNTATATGKDPQNIDVTDTSGTAVDNDTSTETIIPKSASLAFVKTGVYNGNATKAQVGDKITYTFTVTNTGNVTVKNIVINDAKLGVSNLSLIPATLAPAATGVVTQDYTITQSDINAGKVTNSAIAIGKDPQDIDVQDVSGTTVSNDISTETILPKSASIAFVKTGVYNGDATKAKVGDKITYTFTVTNTGNVTIDNIAIIDVKLGITNLVLVPSTLAPSASGQITQDYEITQADIDAGKVTNTATATGKDPQGVNVFDISGTTVNNDTSTETTLPESSSIAVMKTATISGTGTGLLGETVNYTFTVKNTGNTTLTNVVVTDPMTGIILTGNPIASLAPDAISTAIAGTYVITQNDIDEGKISNQATVTAKDPQNNDVTDMSGTTLTTDDTTDTPLTQSSSIALMKTAVISGTGTGLLGETITYTFAVKNTGNTTLTNVVVTDPMSGLTLTGSPIASLAPGITSTAITGTYVITQDDVDDGKVSNQATVTAKDPKDNTVTDLSGTTLTTDDITETPVAHNSSIALVKTAVYNGNATKAQVGDTISYTFSVTNTGNTNLINIVVMDPMAGLILTGSPIVSLSPGVTNSGITGVYTITQADIEAGKVSNQATVTALDPDNNPVSDLSGTAIDNDAITETGLPQSPKIALILKGEFQDENQDGQAQIGETILYTYTIMNMGDVPLSNVWIKDQLAGLDENSGTIDMPIGAMDTTTFSASYSITQEDIIAGHVMNQATVYGTSPLGVVVQDLSDDDSPLEDDSTVIGVEGCVVEVFNAVSPNEGSGYERILYIRGLDCYPNNSVQVFDRWGVKVFEVDGYDNNAKAFRGISEGRATVSQSKALPSGTYYYVLKYVDPNSGEAHDKAGYLHLIN